MPSAYAALPIGQEYATGSAGLQRKTYSFVKVMTRGLRRVHAVETDALIAIPNVERCGLFRRLGVLIMVALRASLPDLPAPKGGSALAELRVLTRGKVLGALALTVIASCAMFTVFTYIAPIIREATGPSLPFVTAMLVTYGVGLTVRNWLGGKFTDRSVDRTLTVTLASLTLVLVAFAMLMSYAAVVAVLIFPWGIANFALVPPLQLRVMTTASDAPNLASAVNICAFNLGNAFGAALGGGVISLNLGYPAVALAEPPHRLWGYSQSCWWQSAPAAPRNVSFVTLQGRTAPLLPVGPSG